MHLILTGATGLVGSGVLDAMIKMKDVTKISVLSRRPVRMAEDAKDPRINVIINQDFEHYDPAILSQLKGAKGCVWALGISQTQVSSNEEYVKITKTFALEASKAFQNLAPDNEPFNFVYVSGEGATTQPGRFASLFARVKGETELALSDMRRDNPLFHSMSMRPAGVDAGHHDAIKPYLPVQGVVIGLVRTLMMPVVRYGLKDLWSPTESTGRFLTELAMGRHQDKLVVGPGIQKIGEFPIISNVAYRRFTGFK